MDERKLRRKNVMKVVRSIFELAVILAVIVWAVVSLVRYRARESLLLEDSELDCVMLPGSEVVAGWTPAATASGPHFIAVSYNGLTDVERPDGKIVTKAAYEEQLQTLKASGYQTITQQSVLDYYLNGGALPEKAMLLIFEDGIMNTTRLAHPALWKPPFVVDITGDVGSSKTAEVSIRITNRWPNRLIGDDALPEEQRGTWTSWRHWKKNEKPLPSGLLGPVSLVRTQSEL